MREGLRLDRPIRVRILDQEYLIKSDEDEERVKEIARFVNEKFREIRDNTEGLSERKTAILAAFHIASDYFHLLREYEDFEKDIRRRVRALNYQIDSVTR
jgi:cell division protein ZapA